MLIWRLTNPPVGKDPRPDLASIVPSNVPILPDNLDKRAPSVAPEKKHVPANINSKAVTGEAVKVSNCPKKNPTSAPDVSASLIDPEKFVDEILEKTSLVVLSEIKSEATKQHVDELGYVVSNSIRRQLTTEFKNIATIFRNTAYTEGFQAGIHHQLKGI
ncbi:hypothetical protein ACH5RR_009485 [Cinchona calisaya]|uniref:Uncharacterized protein n=1 Tax=Cinchona calisaya TaxID=153742 RepID=A0ABD3AIF3_9GENT